MPKFLLPIRSGRHRQAAIGLYRALLTQCHALGSFSSPQRDALANIVRTRFKQTQHVQSTRILHVAFQAGYEAIDQLDAAIAGNGDSRIYILSLLRRAPEHVKDTPHTVRPKASRKQEVKAARREAAQAQLLDRQSKKPPISLFDRPLPLHQLSGKRHIPILANASGIPFLRIKKPQPYALSAYLDQRIKTRQKRNDLLHKLNDAVELARQEDAWDRLVGLHEETVVSAGDGSEGKVRWSSAPRLAIRELEQKFEEDKAKRQVMAEKMQGVVDRETELAERERVERDMMEQGRKEREFEAAEDDRTEVPIAASENASTTTGSEQPIVRSDGQVGVG